MNRIEKTLDLHKNGKMNCSQAILTAFGEQVGLEPETSKMLGRPWAGGIGHMAQTCGYLMGAVLVLSQAFGNEDEGRSRMETDKAVRKLFLRFEERRGATRCQDLLGADMNTEAGIHKILKEKLVEKYCYAKGGIGQDVSEILEELLCFETEKKGENDG
jgi:C_GCAxxG_C_C family probable redox protein